MVLMLKQLEKRNWSNAIAAGFWLVKDHGKWFIGFRDANLSGGFSSKDDAKREAIRLWLDSKTKTN